MNDLQPTNLAIRFGGDSDLNLILLRIASIFSVEEVAINQFPDVRGALLGCAQWMYTFGAIPNKHTYLLPFNTKYTYLNDKNVKITDYRIKYQVADSFEWRQSSAQQAADERSLILRQQTIEIEKPADQERFARLGLTDNVHGGPYHVEDILYKCRILIEDRRANRPNPTLNFAEATQLADPYTGPAWHWGWWKRFGTSQRDGDNYKWVGDNVPHGRTRDWVAVKRGIKSALAMDFELRPVKGWLQLNDRQRLHRIHDELDEPTQNDIDQTINNAFFAEKSELREEPCPSDPTNPLLMALYA